MSNVTDIKTFKIKAAIKDADDDLRERLLTVCETTAHAIKKGIPTATVLKVFETSMALYFPSSKTEIGED